MKPTACAVVPPGNLSTIAFGMSDATYSATSALGAARSRLASNVGACTDGSTLRTSVSYQMRVSSRATSGVAV